MLDVRLYTADGELLVSGRIPDGEVPASLIWNNRVFVLRVELTLRGMEQHDGKLPYFEVSTATLVVTD